MIESSLWSSSNHSDFLCNQTLFDPPYYKFTDVPTSRVTIPNVFCVNEVWIHCCIGGLCIVDTLHMAFGAWTAFREAQFNISFSSHTKRWPYLNLIIACDIKTVDNFVLLLFCQHLLLQQGYHYKPDQYQYLQTTHFQLESDPTIWYK